MELVSLLTSTTSKGNPNAWDISKAYYDAGADAWDISKSGYSGANFSVSAQEAQPTGLFFKPDGTKMYVVGASGDDVNEYTLSTPWIVSSASYVQNFSVATEDTSPSDLFFKPDGTKMYVLGNAGDDVNEYSLSSAWDISTASYVQNFSVATEDTDVEGLFFKPDGTKMYVLGNAGDDVNEYSLSSAWDISTASYVQNFSVASQESAPRGLFFKSDGTKMYVIGSTGDDINEYALSTPWDISTASYATVFSISAQEATPHAVFFHPDGIGFYIVGQTNDTVYQYAIGGFGVGAEELSPEGIFFKPDGTKMYITGFNGDEVNEYNLSTAWDISTASYLQNFSVATQATSPTDLFFKPDGTKMYVLDNPGTGTDYIYEYDLSTPWDISTASYLQFRAVTEETSPDGIFFKPDGTKMYVTGATGDDVNEYNLSTAWDITSETFVQTFSVASQEINPSSLFFKDDGTTMYVIGTTSSNVNQYALATPWDISTASYVQNFSVAGQGTGAQGIFFKPDGTQFFVISSNVDRIHSYLISPT
jgi:sugar lactone lactonase YvrE